MIFAGGMQDAGDWKLLAQRLSVCRTL